MTIFVIAVEIWATIRASVNLTLAATRHKLTIGPSDYFKEFFWFSVLAVGTLVVLVS